MFFLEIKPDDPVDPCQMCSAYKENNVKFCFFCRKRKLIPKGISAGEYARLMAKRGEAITNDT